MILLSILSVVCLVYGREFAADIKSHLLDYYLLSK